MNQEVEWWRRFRRLRLTNGRMAAVSVIVQRALSRQRDITVYAGIETRPMIGIVCAAVAWRAAIYSTPASPCAECFLLTSGGPPAVTRHNLVFWHFSLSELRFARITRSACTIIPVVDVFNFRFAAIWRSANTFQTLFFQSHFPPAY